MSVTKLHERLERIERAYLAVLDGRYPETVPPSIWQSAIFAAVPDTDVEEITEMFRWRARKASQQRTFFRVRGLDQNTGRYWHVSRLRATCCAVDLHARDGAGRLLLFRQVRRRP